MCRLWEFWARLGQNEDSTQLPAPASHQWTAANEASQLPNDTTDVNWTLSRASHTQRARLFRAPSIRCAQYPHDQPFFTTDSIRARSDVTASSSSFPSTFSSLLLSLSLSLSFSFSLSLSLLSSLFSRFVSFCLSSLHLYPMPSMLLHVVWLSTATCLAARAPCNQNAAHQSFRPSVPLFFYPSLLFQHQFNRSAYPRVRP